MRNREYTFIYSSPCIEPLQELINEMLLIFNSPLRIDDIFYYGVFCKPETYANYQHWDEAPLDMEVPFYLTNPCSTEKDRMEYVKDIIVQVMKGEMDKPSWMIYVEMEEICNEYEQAPSTFLYIEVKDETYRILAEKLLNFLYSPNMIITFANS